jgi:hypothetical protein
MRVTIFLSISLLLSVFASRMQSQAIVGSLHGQVADPTGAVIPNARVTIKRPGAESRRLRTDQSGEYHSGELPAGLYVIAVSAKGFGVFQGNVEIVGGREQTLNISLKIERTEEIVVEGHDDGPSTDPANNANASVLKDRDLDLLSDDPTDMAAEILELAGPAAGPDIGQFYVDGFAKGLLPPKSSIKEIRLNRNPFAAEQDKVSFARVDIVTRSGPEQYHGQTSIVYSDPQLNARNPFVPEKPSQGSDVFNFSIGGPVTKKISFFVSAQQRTINDIGAINALVLDSAFNPLPFSESLHNPKTLLAINPRVDFRLGTNDALTASYQDKGTRERNDGIMDLNLASQAYDQTTGEQRIQISETHTFSATVENESRLEYFHYFNRQDSQNNSPLVAVIGAFAGGGNFLGNTTQVQNYFELQNHTLINRPKHAIKFGGRLRSTKIDLNSTQGFNGQFTFDSLNSFRITVKGLQQGLMAAQIRAAGGGASQLAIVDGQPFNSATVVDAGVYIQDDWRFRRNMTASYGVRYEAQNAIDDHLNIAPRLGFAWGLGSRDGGPPKTIIRAGAGIFYSRVGADLVSLAERQNGINTKQFIFPDPDFFPNLPNLTLSTQQSRNQPFLPTITKLDPKIRAPYTTQASIAVERQVAKNTSVSVAYLYSRGVRQILSRNINAPLPGTFDPGNFFSGVRPLGGFFNVFEYQSHGTFKQSQLITNVNMRGGKRILLLGRYVLNYASSNTGEFNTFPSNQFDPRGDYGRAPFDVRHRVYMGSTIDLPMRFRLSPFVVADSGSPFDIVIGEDLNGDSLFNDRPSFVTDLSRPSVVRTRFGIFDTDPIPGQTRIPRNFGTGSAVYTFNLRVSKTFVFREPRAGKVSTIEKRWDPKHSITLNAYGQNLLNHVNAGEPVGSLDSPLFGQATTVKGAPFSVPAANRRINLELIYSF